jgi:hypothetical protein
MDWSSHQHAFFYHQARNFTCDLDAKDNLRCRAHYGYGAVSAIISLPPSVTFNIECSQCAQGIFGVDLKKIILSEPHHWQELFDVNYPLC